MKLIDILNKIANGELKEGTKVKVGIIDDDVYTYDGCCELIGEKGERIFDVYTLYALHQEVELIEPDYFADVGKMAEPTDNTKIEELEYDETDLECLGIHSKTMFLNIADKLNEIIRYINKED